MSLDPVSGGGSVERTFQMSRFLVKSGVGCSVLTTDIGLTPERIKDLAGVTVVALKSLNKRFYVPLSSFEMIKSIVKNADIIHLMNHWTLLNVIVYFFAKRLNKPYVVCPAGSLPVRGPPTCSGRPAPAWPGRSPRRPSPPADDNSNCSIALLKHEEYCIIGLRPGGEMSRRFSVGREVPY